MKTRSTTIIAAGVVTALIGALTVFAYARSVQGQTGGRDAVSAFVATSDIPAGAKWEDASVAEKEVPADVRPASAVTSRDQLAGRTAVRAISAGEVVTTAAFGASDHAPAGGLGIPPGHNAVTINVGAPQGVARFVQPGDLVNVFASFKGAADVRPATVTKLILSNVQVLQNRSASEVASRTGAESSGELLITVAVTPADAEQLIFAKENASLWLGLVHAGDGPASTTGATAQSVIG
ncbi:MAG TPA: Flp pilus assembly protein CpaB [Actinomycetota bacterium]|nr:Flp pilus assembly protein CpaB [Actinomycetota bacterium]